MKKFSELTQQEIKWMTPEEFAAVSPFEKKSCGDCACLVAKISWWCGNKEAIKLRGTAIPGIIKCPFWQPDWQEIQKQYKTAENGYVSRWDRFKQWLFRYWH